MFLPAGRAGLLSLEPGPEAILVEDVSARQLLRGRRHHHLVPADDAHVVGVGQLLGGRVRVPRVHCMDGTAVKQGEFSKTRGTMTAFSKTKSDTDSSLFFFGTLTVRE